jgi:GNAT superfamily N-acetyltransferase
MQGSAITPTATLLAEVFPGSHVTRPEYLEWLYEQSPFGLAIEANLDDEQGRAGHYALVPILLARDGADRRGALSLNTAVHERARGGGVFVRLASEAIDEAGRRGVEAVVGVANANSTPGFLRHLEFELLASLPACVMVPTPGSRDGIRSCWADSAAFAPNGLVTDLGALIGVPTVGEARRWTLETLRWRLARPGFRYALHGSRDLLAVSCEDRRHGVRVAILLKVFAGASVSARARRALVRAACRFHRAPLALHVGLNDHVDFSGIALPQRLRESPLNLIYRSLGEHECPASIVDFEFLDFDAY